MIQVTITNTQSQATSAPFQVRLTLDLSSIISSDSQLINLGFYLSSNLTNQIYAWIESHNSNFSQVVVWVNLPNGIPASSSVTVYICLQSSSQYPYTGMAPQLTLPYGEYDNGENVFLFYDNFAGTSLNTNKWKALTSSYSVDNGLTIDYGTSDVVIVSVQSFDMPYIVDVYANDVTTYDNSGIIFGYNGSTEYALYTFSYNLWEGTPTNDGETELQSNSYDKGGNEIVTIKVTSSELEFEYNYQEVNTYSGSINGNGNIGFGSNPGATANATYYWVRVRAYPPNGVDPTVTVSSSPTSTTSSSSNVQNEALYMSQASTSAQAQNEAFYIQQAQSKANTQNEAFYVHQATVHANVQNEAFYVQQVSTIKNVQNEAFYIQPYKVSPTQAQNEAFYVQPYKVFPTQAQNEAFFVKQVTISLPVHNEAFFIQQVQIKVTHITIPEYIHFISIPQGYYNDLSLSISVSTELTLAQQYSFEISYNITVSTQIKTTTIPTPQNVELDAIEVGIFIPALYFLGKKLYNKLVKRRKK